VQKREPGPGARFRLLSLDDEFQAGTKSFLSPNMNKQMFKEGRFFGGKDESGPNRVKMKTGQAPKESMQKTKIEDIYRQCLEAMKEGKPCQPVSNTEGGLDECEPFGKEGWDTVTWTDKDKEDAKNIENNDYEKTVKCLKTKVKKILDSRVDSRKRMVTTGQKTGTNSRRSKQ